DQDPCGPSSLLGYHMPYMRWWDTGVSDGNPRHGGSFLNTMGGWDTLIGVGREEITQEDVDQYQQDQQNWQGVQFDNQDPGLWTKPEDVSVRPSQMGRMGDIPEFYAHEMWTIRLQNDYCVGRYEKYFKPFGPEALALGRAGTGYESMGDPMAVAMG